MSDELKPKDEWYAYSPGTGFDQYDTAEAAEEAAEASLEHYRDQSGDGWSEEAENVHWGRILVLGFSSECDRKEAPEGSEFDYTCDYRLHACTDELARLRESDEKLRAENAALREQLAARETVQAMTREAAYEIVERELRAITGFDGIRFMRLNVHPWTVRAFEKDKSSAPKLLEAVDALKGGKNG